jgi:putative transposase
LLRSPFEFGTEDEIRNATNGNYGLGDEQFIAEIESVLGRRITPGKPGRPKKYIG